MLSEEGVEDVGASRREDSRVQQQDEGHGGMKGLLGNYKQLRILNGLHYGADPAHMWRKL